MKHGFLVMAGIATAAQAALVQAQSPDHKPVTLPEVTVTGNPLGSELFEQTAPASVLQGDALFRQRQSTLGETLNGLPGVSSTYFGPNASRPVIRGLEGDRIRLLQNGAGMHDASSVSYDHAVALDPLVIERAEVVRGPAALFYGGSAVGGVVNVIDNRIPVAPIEGISGRAESRFGGAQREKASGLLLEGGNGSIALHADVYTRDTDDLKIKGFARSARLRATSPQANEAFGTLPNSASKSSGGAFGVSRTWTDGYVGLSHAGFDSTYGTVAEPNVTIDMQSNRWDLAGEVRGIDSAVTAVKFKGSATDYKHVELDAGVPATRFRNKGQDWHVEARHRRVGALEGAFGMQWSKSEFSALGAEVFVPPTSTDSKAGFLFEELALGAWKLSVGGRHEMIDVSSQGGNGVGQPRFNPAQTRSFNANSGALGAVFTLTPAWSVAANAAYTERAPTFYELFANGPHAATGAFEVGDATLGKEKSKAIDLALRMKSGAHRGSISVFQNRFTNFVTLFGTGNTRGADGELNPVDGDNDGVADGSGEEISNEFQYRAVPARFRGIEADGRFRLLSRGSTLDLLLKAGIVNAVDTRTGRSLPRIPQRQLGVGLDYHRDRLGAQLDVTRYSGQGKVAANELPTDGYTWVNAGLSYRLPVRGGRLDGFVQGINLLNEEARNHTSFLKDRAPMGRRSVMVGVRGQL